VSGTEARWIGDYFIDGELGRGAMGVVYRVRHRAGHGPFALKLLKAETLEDSRALKRFAAEVGSQRVLGAYPGIVGVIDSGFVARGPFYVMPLVAGTNLRELLRDQKEQLPETRALEYVGAVVRALAYAHEQGFVHRDVKPENVMVTPEGEVFLTDFGIVRVLGGHGRLTRTGELLGTPLFMAPEQVGLDFGKPGPPTDVYAVGVILYQIICKRSPYEALTSVALMGAILQGEPYPSPASLRPGLSAAWVRVLDRCLARAPEDRYANAGALWKDMSEALAGPIATPAKRVGRLALAALVLLAALGGFAFGLSKRTGNPAPSPSRSLAALPSSTSPSGTPAATASPGLDVSPSPSPAPEKSVEERLRDVWVSGDEAAFETLAEALGALYGEDLEVFRLYEGRVKQRRAWRALLGETPASERKALRAFFLRAAKAQGDSELRLLAKGFEAFVAVLYDDWIHPSAPFAYFHKGELPALPELMRFVSLVRPPAEALERWPATIYPAERARVAAWIGDVDACRASLAVLPVERRAALGWSLFAFVDPEELDLPAASRRTPTDRLGQFYRILSHAEEALAKGNTITAALTFEQLSKEHSDVPQLQSVVKFGLIRCYLALGRVDEVVERWVSSTRDFAGDPTLLSEVVGLGILIGESLREPRDEKLIRQLQATLGPEASVFAVQSPWTNRLQPDRGLGVPMTRLERQGGTLSDQLALAEGGAGGALGLGLARLYRLARSCPGGLGIDQALELYPLLDRFAATTRGSLLPDAIRARLDLVTCRIGTPPPSLVAAANRDEQAADLVFQLRVADYERDWFELAEQRLLAKKPLPRGREVRALEAKLAAIKAEAKRTEGLFPQSETFLLFRARLLVEEARLAWLHSAKSPTFKGLDRRVEIALGPLLQFDLASDLESALRALDSPQIEVELLLRKLGQARANVTPHIAGAWAVRAMAGGPHAVLFHRARRVVDYDAPIVALGRTRQMERALRRGTTKRLPEPEFGGETLGAYSLRAARTCTLESFPLAWDDLVFATGRQLDLLPWAVVVLRHPSPSLREMAERADPRSTFRLWILAVGWIGTGISDVPALAQALAALRPLPPGPLRAFATLWALSNFRPRTPLIDFLAQEAALEVDMADPTCVSSRRLLHKNGIPLDAVSLDRALATGLVYGKSGEFVPKRAAEIRRLFVNNLWADSAWKDLPRTRAALEYLKFVESSVKADPRDTPWVPEPKLLQVEEGSWATVGHWDTSLGDIALRARGHLEQGDWRRAVRSGIRHLFLTRPRSLSGAAPPAPLRILPTQATQSELDDPVVVADDVGWRTAARLLEAGESWRILADAGALSSDASGFSAFPEALGRSRGSDLGGLPPRLGSQPTRDLVRWIALEEAHGQRLTETVLRIVESPSLLERVELPNLAYWLSWLSSRSSNSARERVLAGLAVWVSCRIKPSKWLKESEIATLRSRYAVINQGLRGGLVEGGAPIYRLQIAWPKLLAGVVTNSASPGADTSASQALGELERLPSWLANEPLLPKVLEAYPVFRKAYEKAERESPPKEQRSPPR